MKLHSPCLQLRRCCCLKDFLARSERLVTVAPLVYLHIGLAVARPKHQRACVRFVRPRTPTRAAPTIQVKRRWPLLLNVVTPRVLQRFASAISSTLAAGRQSLGRRRPGRFQPRTICPAALSAASRCTARRRRHFITWIEFRYFGTIVNLNLAVIEFRNK